MSGTGRSSVCVSMAEVSRVFDVKIPTRGPYAANSDVVFKRNPIWGGA